MRVWLLTNEPSPYQAELFRAIAQRETLQLEVRFMRDESPADRERRATRGFEHQFLQGWGPRWRAGQLRVHPQALKETAAGAFDCYVLSGYYTSVTFLLCVVLLAIRRKPWMLWLERPREPWTAGEERSFLGKGRRLMRRAVLRFLARRSHRLLAIGSAAAQTYRRLGAPADRIRVLPYCCDTSRFAQVEEDAVQRIVGAHRLHAKTVFLYSGQLIERKNVTLLLDAFAAVACERKDVALVLLGDGPLRGECERRLTDGLRDRVHFAGWRPQAELPAFFQAADVFVFPSRHDGWAVVINEACAAGLPVIASRQTGAAHDLVAEGANGFLLDRDDLAGFCEKMRFFADHPEWIRPFGERSREMVSRFSAEEGARRFHAAIMEVV
jgi:glycosyltransferase involved in cell wall biosynthesis